MPSPHLANLDTTLIGDVIARGWGLAITCRDCARAVRWTDAVLEERFITSLGRRAVDLADRLKCACGSKALRVYYYQAGARGTGAKAAAGVSERLTALAARAADAARP